MKDFIVYEHIFGLPEYLDTEAEEVTECVMERGCTTEKEVERYVNQINEISPTDKHGRKRNLYVYWI